MKKCKIQLLGPVLVNWETAEPPRFRSQRTKALLGYLAVERRPVAREILATLLWPDETTTKGRANLRRELYNLNNILPDCWQTDRQVVAFEPSAKTWADIYELQSLADAEKWPEAAGLIRGEFLEGVHLEDNMEFETWLLGERERWRQRAEHILSQAVLTQVNAGDGMRALRYARRLLQLLPWHEQMHRQVMLLLAQQGRRSAALRQFEQCQAQLQQELGVDVSTETLALYEQIRDASTFSLHNIPAAITPLIGREQELAQLDRWLLDSDIRLITITGTGGIGKTRLALALAQQSLEKSSRLFIDGIYFVSLASLDDPEHIVSTLAAVLKFPLRDQGKRSTREQLLDYLRQKQMLLILDNFEHLLPGANIITDILQAAPSVHIMATSRERLRLQGEQVLPLYGLAYNEETALPEIGNGRSSAAQLFLTAAKRVRPDFRVREEDEVILRHICGLVEGMPLALELAATWADTLSLKAIADEIKSGIDFLETDMRDAPPRHRSMRAVFDASWQRLSPREQRVFARLSVFRGGFTLEAAEAVTRATAQTLSHLINGSLLSYEQELDRYEIHELLRQYVASLLTSGAADRAHRRHLIYFADLVNRLQSREQADEQKAVLDQLETDFGNIRAALNWSLREPKHTSDGLRLAASLEHYWHTRSHNHVLEGREWLSNLLAAPDNETPPLLRAKALRVAGQLEHFGVRDRAKAIAFCKESLVLHKALADKEGQIRTLCCLGQIEYHHHNLKEATAYYKKALNLAKERDDRWGMCTSLHGLGLVALAQQEIEAAYGFLQNGLSVARELGDLIRMAHILSGLGLAATEKMEWNNGHAWLEEAVLLCRKSGYKEGLAHALTIWGDLARSEGKYELAESHYKESLVIKCEVGALPWPISLQSFNLGQTNLMMGRLDQAVDYLEESLRQGKKINSPELIHFALEGIANAASAQKEPKRAAALWGAAEVTRKSVGTNLTLPDIIAHDHFVSLAREQTDEGTFNTAWAEGRKMTLEEAVNYALEAV